MDALESHLRVRRIKAAAAYTVAVLMVGYLLLNCSGLNLPIRRPADDLAGMLSGAYGVALPPSAVVERGGRQATVRNTYYFAVRMNPADVRPFVAALRVAGSRAGRQPVDRDLRTLPQREPPPPTWWVPGSLASPAWLDLVPLGRGSGLWVIYSERDGRALVWWYAV